MTEQSNLTELSAGEMETVDGGTWAQVGIVVGGYIVASWADIKQGLSDGWNS